LGVGDELDPVAMEHVGEEQLGIEPRRVGSALAQILGRPRQNLADAPGLHQPPSAARASATTRSTAARMASRCSAVLAPKRSTSTGPVFDARQRPQAPSSKRIRAQATSPTSSEAAKWCITATTTSNLIA